MTRYKVLVLAFWLAAAVWYFLSRDTDFLFVPSPAGMDQSGTSLYWFKGNTHAHAKIQLDAYSHGDSTVPDVAAWYREHGYQFLAISDHNRFEDARDLNAQTVHQQDFLVIPAMEITSDYLYPGVNQAGKRRIHATAFNVAQAVDWNFEDPDKAGIIQQHAERIAIQGGLHILNHPNYRFQVELADILAAGDLKLFEVHNDHPRSNQEGHQGFRPSVEDLWDQALSSGHLLYGLASDDAHDFKWYRQMLRRFGMAPPGGGWIMVKSAGLTPKKLTDSIISGDFYSSTGVHLKQVIARNGFYEVEIDRQRTLQETQNPWVKNSAPRVFSDDSHFVIEFIGAEGKILKQTHNEETAGIWLQAQDRYVRAKVTYLEKISSITGADQARAYYAWTQPLMYTTATQTSNSSD